MFTGIIEELGTVEAVEDQGDAVRLTVAGAHVARRRRRRRLDRRQRLLPHRGRAHDGEVASPPTSCRRPSTRPRSRRPARRPGQPRARGHRRRSGSAATSSRATSTAPAQIRRPDPQRALGGRRDRRCRRDGALPRRQGLDHRRRRLASPSSTVERRRAFTVSLIPETLARTTLGTEQPGDRVNLEVDVIAKHVEKLVGRLRVKEQPMTQTRSASTPSSGPSPTSPPARRSSSSTTRTARTRATSSSRPARRRRS